MNGQDYLRNDDNKIELFVYLPEALLDYLKDIRTVTNVGRKVASSVALNTSLQHIDFVGLEEADGRIIFHTIDMVSNGAK